MPNDWLDKLMYYTFRSGTQKAFDEMQREMHEDIYHADIDRYKDVYDHLKKKKNISEKEREKALREIEAMIENAIKTKYTFSPFEHREAIEETWGFKEKRKAEAKRKKEKKVEVTFKDEFISNIYKMLEELSDIDDQNHTNEERIALEKTRETASLVVSILRDVYNGDKKTLQKGKLTDFIELVDIVVNDEDEYFGSEKKQADPDNYRKHVEEKYAPIYEEVSLYLYLT